MQADLCYLSVACNHTPSICDWGKNDLMCYGACNSIIIHNPNYPGTAKDVVILTGHKKRVNAVRWIRKNDYSAENEIVSASTDGTAIIWTLEKTSYKTFVLVGHEDSVNNIDALYVNDKTLLVVTASSDSTVRVWKRHQHDGEVKNIQTVSFGLSLSLALKLTFLPHSEHVLLACACDNSKIQLYTFIEKDDSQFFNLVETLSGHESWVRGLDFTTNDNGNVYLASCSQDTFIRIWCISPSSGEEETDSFVELLKLQKMRAMQKTFSLVNNNQTQYYSVHLESVLCGHEGWVYGVNWCPKICNEVGTITQPMKLLSSSIDKSMLIWSLDETTGLWMESVRVGEVGGNTLGFYGSSFSPNGSSIIGHGYSGSFHMWNYNPETDSWEPRVTVGGHSNEVVDIAWEPNGEYLMSISYDQTTRIHAPWVHNNDKNVSWHEIARPQVHGYDMSCLAILSRYRFVSGAEEKIIRAFKAPSNFVTNFRRISNITDDRDSNEILSVPNIVPKGASLPSLGLSNKAVFEISNEKDNKIKGKEQYPEDSYFHEINLEAPPTEENLLQNTLWPEVQKLYGHGYELFSLASSNKGDLIASACKATTRDHAAIILWDAQTWQQKQKLVSHTLTVTQIMFSPDDSKILSVSRDRRWTVFERSSENDEYVLRGTTDKKTGIHTRIIWCCSWSYDSKYFVTGSRDGKVVIWWKNEKNIECNSVLGSYEAASAILELKGESVTAVSFAPILVDGYYLLCFGLESGIMFIYKWNNEKSWEKCIQLDKSAAHHLTVKRISFRPRVGMAGVENSDENILQMASCGSDHTVKVHNILLHEQ